ncbi:MAG: prepilin-type N-terminal cleavage/methylation domain-containing protein, partial [Candidatus Gottesmanbacteria bacterium]|nr:prepilin-type N-terminal cleavage/methylation domain-containing protein [Candidatus Gottesmanbacteria bacterium]
MKKFQRGFTLIEILIVVSIIVLLSMAVLMNIFGQMAHATDIKRKTDLYTLSKFFEDYYNDNGAFPAQS